MNTTTNNYDYRKHNIQEQLTSSDDDYSSDASLTQVQTPKHKREVEDSPTFFVFPNNATSIISPSIAALLAQHSHSLPLVGTKRIDAPLMFSGSKPKSRRKRAKAAPFCTELFC